MVVGFMGFWRDSGMSKHEKANRILDRVNEVMMALVLIVASLDVLLGAMKLITIMPFHRMWDN